jgi:hypothetical protein
MLPMANSVEIQGDLTIVKKSSPVNVWDKVIKEVRKLRRSLPHAQVKERSS